MNFLLPLVSSSSSLGPNIPLSIQFSDIVILCSSLNVRECHTHIKPQENCSFVRQKLKLSLCVTN
jgi:hypothetical protein